MSEQSNVTEPARSGWKANLYRIIFHAETRAGKAFDVILLWAIVLSVIAVMLESVTEIKEKYGPLLITIEWIFTGLFTIEYVARIITVKRPMKYITSFFGIVDLLSILPAYIGIIYTDTASLRVIRILRLMRIFRVLKLIGFLKQGMILRNALVASRRKITIFLLAVLILVVILGTVMYIIEDPESGFTSIPRSIYWAIVTLTTVGYGDIAPQTAIGQALASIVMVIGYAIIAVPTGIVTAELTQDGKSELDHTRECSNCVTSGHQPDAHFCRNCGEVL